MNKELQEIEDWKRLRPVIKDSYDFDDNWNKAIAIFKNRLKTKFFDPIENIINKNDFKGEGFTILTVQCALIEALASFRTGQIFNHRKRNSSPSYEYKESGKIFVDFLLSASIFEDNFYTKSANEPINKDTPFNAELFYKEVRCGLMHEAKTKGKWIINANSNHSREDKIFLVDREGKNSILRTVLHFRLLEYINGYCEELKRIESNNLRKHFARKLDHLFETFDDKEDYNWWTE